MNTKLSLALAALVLTPGLASAGPAKAFVLTADDVDTPSVVVRFSDLDLSTKDGLTALHHRLFDAAYRVCRDMTPTPSIENAKCRQELVQEAVDNVNTKLKLVGEDTRVLR
jgi:UrcA family protein